MCFIYKLFAYFNDKINWHKYSLDFSFKFELIQCLSNESSFSSIYDL